MECKILEIVVNYISKKCSVCYDNVSECEQCDTYFKNDDIAYCYNRKHICNKCLGKKTSYSDDYIKSEIKEHTLKSFSKMCSVCYDNAYYCERCGIIFKNNEKANCYNGIHICIKCNSG